jgi:hypothetical protein
MPPGKLPTDPGSVEEDFEKLYREFYVDDQ